MPHTSLPRFSAAQRCALARALDELIPARPDGALPGAGSLGLADAVETALRATPALHAAVAQSLDAADARARAEHGQPFDALAADAQIALVRALATSEHALPPAVLLQTYAAYYADPRVLAGLGLPPRPPHPEGYALAPSDLEPLLAPVRAGGKRYRDV